MSILQRLAFGMAVVASIVAPGTVHAQNAPPAPAFIGTTPDPSGTACPGEDLVLRHPKGPEKIAISADSAKYFLARNQHNYGIFILVVRMDGEAAISFPASQDYDPEMRAALVAYAKAVTIDKPIAGCAHPAVIVVAHVFVPDGTITFALQSLSPNAPTPTPMPSATVS